MPVLNPTSAHPSDKRYDVIVIGGGMGGLIAACQLAQAGKRVALLENLSFVGGRFTAFKVDGAEIPSGAFHTFPHGTRGPFAQALRRCRVNVKIPTPHVFASFHVGGKHVVAKTGFDVFRVVPHPADKLMLWRVLLQSWATLDFAGTFGDWLISLGASEAVRTIFDRFCQFSLSTTIYDVPYKEGRSVIEATIHYGLPGVPVGGAREVARQLNQVAIKAGVTIFKRTQAIALLSKEGKVDGVIIFDRSRNETDCFFAPTIISDIGPANTYRLVETTHWEDSNGFSIPQMTPPAAIGLKIQIQSPKSLIQHDGIMFCLDTKRIAGILQATNIDPSLAAPDQHL